MGLQVYSPEGELVLSLPAAAPQLASLPDLITIDCPTCHGEGYLLAPDPMLSTRCTGCYGAKVVQVCPDCFETPDGATDLCGCAPETTCAVACETCERLATELRDGICLTCFAEGVAIIQREAEEHVAFVAEQLESTARPTTRIFGSM